MNLQEFMNDNNLTIEGLNGISDVSESTIKRAIKGENINVNSINRLASALEVSEDALKCMINAPSSSDELAKLVDGKLQELSELGLSFGSPHDRLDSPLYRIIEKDLIDGPNFFPDEFKAQVKNAVNKNQLEALRQLAVYCAAYLINRDLDIQIKEHSLIEFSDGDNAWELRTFIHSSNHKLDKLEINLIKGEHSDQLQLAPAQGAYELSASASVSDLELIIQLARQISQKEGFALDKCPEAVNPGNSKQLETFKIFCSELDKHIAYHRQLQTNVFAHTAGQLSPKFKKLLLEYLPSLHLMSMKVDDAPAFLVAGNKFEIVLCDLLPAVQAREVELSVKNINNEDKSMKQDENGSKTDPMKTTVNNFNGSIGTVVTGDQNQIEIGNKLDELVPVLKDFKEYLAPFYSKDSEEIQVLDKLLNEKKPNQELMKKTGKVLDGAKKFIQAGSKLSGLYNKAEALIPEIIRMMA